MVQRIVGRAPHWSFDAIGEAIVKLVAKHRASMVLMKIHQSVESELRYFIYLHTPAAYIHPTNTRLAVGLCKGMV